MLSATEARLLERLTFGTTGLAATAGGAALRHANTRGHGLEFHEFRPYQPGDDLRTIDWKVHARLRQLVVRTTRSDAHLRLHLLLDVSPSMSVGHPTKASVARKLAAALAYVAVRRREAVGLATFDSRVRTFIPPATGRGQIFRVFSALRTSAQGTGTALHDAFSTYGSLTQGPGLVVILSDFFDPQGAVVDGIRYLLHRGLQPALIHIGDAEEHEPSIDGELELTDIENPSRPPIVVAADAVSAYRTRLTQWLGALETFCRGEGISWISLRTSDSLEDAIRACQRAGLIVNQT